MFKLSEQNKVGEKTALDTPKYGRVHNLKTPTVKTSYVLVQMHFCPSLDLT